MPFDNGLLKLVTEGGFFTLFVLVWVWFMFKAEPRYREMILKMEENHSAAITNMAKSHRIAVKRMTLEHRSTVEAILKNHETVVKAMAKECREERLEWMAMVVKEGELNRVARHDFANQVQRAIAEAYNTQVAQEGNGS